MRKIIVLGIIATGITMVSCRAWRTITTTSSYTQVTDTSKVSTTISTKTVEEYQGVKK